MPTFNNYQYSEDGTYQGGRSDAVILGVPCDLGSTSHVGQREAPAAIRASGSWSWDEMYDVARDRLVTKKVVDAGDVPIITGELHTTGQVIADVVAEIVKNTGLLIAMGGDHLASRFISYSLDRPYLVVFDAHSDLWQPESYGESDHGTWVRDVIEEDTVSGVCIVGHRTYGPLPHIWKYVDHIPMVEYRSDPQAALTKVVELANGRRTYLSVDIDVVDPAFAPGTCAPEPGGMESWAILDAVYRLMSELDVCALDVMEVLPSRDHTNLTAKLANRIIATALSTIDRS